jgi:hypothetical protein
MFTMVRVYIKTAIVFLIAGLLLGTVLLIRRELYGIWASGPLLSAHTHALLLGFGLFLIMGVALWLFPKPAADDQRYTPARIKTAYWLLMPATAIRFLSEIVRPLVAAEWLAWPIILTGLTQFSAIALYFYTMWGRIRAVGSHLREAKGERF